MTDALVRPLDRVEARVEPVDWPFAIERKDEIAEHWEKLSSDNPAMFNGTVLLQHRWSIEGGLYRAAYTPVDYASFIAWIRFGQPGTPRRNGFAMAGLRSVDGAFVLGVMAEHTVNAGKIYFPAGTPDLDDVTQDGRVDLAGSLSRELFEETALRPDEVAIEDRWTLVSDGYRDAFMKPARLVYGADEARRTMLDRLSQTDRELADIYLVRRPSDIIEERTPVFASAYMKSVFAAEAITG